MDEPEPTTRRQSRRVTVPVSTHNLRDLRDARTCESCRKLKMKCSGDKPCTLCAQKGATCEYEEPPRQSGRAAASTNGGRKRPAPPSSYAQIKESRQRKRAAAAQTSCDFCRNDLRRKCDGLRPSCQSCIKRGVTCVYTGPASANSSTPTTTVPTPLIPQTSTVVVSDDDSDIVMGSRSGSPDVPLADSSQGNPKPPYPLGNGLGHAGSTRNPDGTNCTRPVACFFCIQVELPCTGDYPTCVNCIRRNRSCSYPDPSSYAHQFPRQSAIHSRQLKDPSRGLTSPGKSLSPGKVPSRGSFDSSSRGVLDLSPRGVLEPSSTLRGILDPTTPTRGVLDTSRGALDAGAPRSAIERGTLDAPLPTLHPSRSLPGPLNQHRSVQPPATPTPPSMSVSPDPSSETSNIRVVNPSTNGNGAHSRQHSSDLSRSASHADLRTPRSSDTFRHVQTPPQGQSTDRDRRSSTSALTGVLGDVRGPQTPGGSANLGGVLVSPSGRTRDGASMMVPTGPIVTKERVDGFVNEGPASYRAKIENAAGQSPRPNIQPSSAQAPQQPSRSTNPQPPVQHSPRPSAPQTPSAPLQQSPNVITQQSPRPTNQLALNNQQPAAPAPTSQSPNAHASQSLHQQQPRRDSTADQPRAQSSTRPVQVSNAGSPRRGSNPPTAPRSMTTTLAPIALPPRPPQPYNQEGHYETGRDLVIGRTRGQGDHDWRSRSGSGSGPGRYEREREWRDERDREWRDDRRDSLPDRRDSMEWREPLPDRRDSLSRREPPLDRDRPERDWPPVQPNWRSPPPRSRPLPNKSGSPPGSSARVGSGGNSPRGAYPRAESRSSPMDMDSS